jgi:hypothetical protein
VVRSRHHGSTRAYFYACSSHYHKGKSVGPNSLETPMLSADNAVLGALEQDVLRPRVLEAAIARAVDHFIRPRDSHSDHARCESLRRAVEKANGEQQRLVDAIAQGAGDVSALVGALRQQQELLLTVRSEPDGLKAPTAASFDREEIFNAAHAHAVDFQGLLRANTTEARRVLATLLDGRLTFTPKRDGRRTFLRIYGRWHDSTDSRGDSWRDFGNLHHKVWRPHRDSNPGFSLERAAS